MKETLRFLSRLKKNNRREWLEEHRDEYENAKREMKQLTGEFIAGISKTDISVQGLTPEKCMFRIHRDVRFSKNKSPYKTNMSASVSPGGKKAISAGYYVHIEPGNSFIAGGIWMPPGEELRKIRQEIDYNGADLKAILSDRKFRSMFGGLDDEHVLKTAPKGYPKDHPDILLLRHTSFICWKRFDDAEVIGKGFTNRLVKSSTLLTPFIKFLNTALD